MRRVCVGSARFSVLFAIAGLAATVALSSPAEAARRKRGGGAYNPLYAAIVVDVKSGRTLHAQNADALRHPASVTKVMTLYLLFEQLEKGRIALSTPLPVSVNASRQAPSKLGLRPGDTIEVEDAIKALVTKSANDVAVVVAEYLGDSEERFAEMMTRKARALGMNSTVYRNASGLPDPEQITTARDLAILGRAIQDRFPRQYKYFQTRVFHYARGSYRNHNKLLGRIEGVDGIKTGYTRASGFNLLTSAKTDDRHIVAVVLGGRSGAARDRAMASLVTANLPRAYAGGRTAPVVAEASEGPRPAVIAEAPRPRPAVVTEPARSRDLDVETTATTATRQPIDLSAMRAVTASAGPTTTPGSILRWSSGSRPVPQAAQAYAPIERDEAKPRPIPASGAAPASPLHKIEARLPAVDAVIAKADIQEPEPEPRSEPIATPVPAASPAPAASVSGWVIQLGAMDDEGKAKEILEEARARSRRVLSKASPFTEKVVRGGATLYRARFSGFDEADSAQHACKVLKRSGFACFATRS